MHRQAVRNRGTVGAKGQAPGGGEGFEEDCLTGEVLDGRTTSTQRLPDLRKQVWIVDPGAVGSSYLDQPAGLSSLRFEGEQRQGLQ